MKLPFLYIAGIFLILTACTTLDEFGQAIDEASKKKIEEVELLLTEAAFTNNSSLLKRAQSLTDELYEKAENNKYFEAKVLGLYGEIAYLEKNYIEVKNYIQEIERRNPKEEKYFILQAHLARENEEKIEILQQGIDKAYGVYQIKLLLSDIYFYTMDFAESAAGYDEVFVKLPEQYQDYYGKRRELAYRFIDNPPQDAKTIGILLEEILTFSHVIRLTAGQTPFLDHIVTADQMDNMKKVMALLYENKFIYSKKAAPDDIIKRSDLAYFLLSIVAYLENNSDLLDKYSVEFDSTNPAKEELSLSPIGDVRTYDYFYNAVLILVEREIMEMPDGENFFPKESVSGINFYQILSQLLADYR